MIVKSKIKKILLKLKNKTCKLYSDDICFDVILHDMVKIYDNVYVDSNCEIGNYTYLSSGTKIYSNTKIGNFCSIGPNVIIAPGEHPLDQFTTHPIIYDSAWNKKISSKCDINKNTVIGNDVWIGCNALIKTGIKIGNGAVIGACSVVTHDVPPYAIVAGNPAKIIRYRFNDDIIQKLIDTKWYDGNLNEVVDKIKCYNEIVRQDKENE